MTTLTGTGLCLRAALRRDRLFWLCWIVVLALMPAFTAMKYDELIPAGSDPRLTLAPLAANPAMQALLGPAFDIYTKGGFTFWRAGGFTAIFAGMMTGFAIIRSTRAEEEAGRLELVRAGAIGRHAPLVAALLESLLGAVAAGVVTAAACMAAGLGTRGSLAGGLALTCCGLVMAGAGAVIGQVFESARTARAWTVGIVFGGMFLIRMMIDGAGTDSGRAWLRWAVPLEWGLLIRPWAGERWWVAALPLALFLALSLLALRLESVRDHGAGLRASRPGRARASVLLSGPFGLAWRLQRNGLIGWVIGLLVGAAGTGSIVSQTGASLARNPQLAEYLDRMGGSHDFEVSFYVAMLTILAGIAGVMAAVLIGSLHREEANGHLESLLATSVSRWRAAASHLVWALAAPVVLMVGVGALLPLSQARSDGDYSLIGQYARSAAALAPGMLLICGIAMALLGWLPRLFNLVWVVIGWTLFTTWFAALINLPASVARVQPWGYLSFLPRDTMDWTPFLVETGIAVVLVGVGLIGYRRRDITA
ncbi:hypothetical protein FEZ32_12915 [Acidipropionibacterium jensenii]|uniref:ABC transporter permease n=1 Tax=Acidipropionibacterium jensenii TaxID=1749 RepID=UPI00110BA113|nr:hypothetical protein [Acidipropionibacterium jensenii]QCV89121.1 hypothetical protein FEZ32_12915 [Acidipropionibacterium jensenii]